ncbi:MAG TPA: DUF3108 domain-containing protein [Usitatibacter sp.]|nr:DUF3108 domain-containing protein [Usitatibacter sp.]
MRALAALLFLVSTAALAIPNEITAEYTLTSFGVQIGRINESFTRKGDTYSIQSVTRSEGALKLVVDDQIVLESSGRIDEAGLRPLRFGQRRARDSSKDIAATFDWENGVMHSRFRGKESDVPLPKETQDRISMMYQFMNWTAPRAGSEVVLAMANGRKVEHYTYRLVDEPRIKTPAGEFDTWHFKRVTFTPKESRAEVWLAKDRYNFPVKVVFDEPDGLKLEQSLVALQAR